MGGVKDPVQDRITEGGVAHDVVPTRHGYLARDQERALVVTVVDDLEEIAALLGGERLGSPVVDDEKLRALEGGHQPREAALAASLGQIGEEPRGALVEDGEAVPARPVAERAGQPTLARAGWAGDRQMLVLAHPLARGEHLEQGSVEAAG